MPAIPSKVICSGIDEDVVALSNPLKVKMVSFFSCCWALEGWAMVEMMVKMMANMMGLIGRVVMVVFYYQMEWGVKECVENICVLNPRPPRFIG